MNPEENQNNTPPASGPMPGPAGPMGPVPPAQSDASSDLTTPVNTPSTDSAALENAVDPVAPETPAAPEPASETPEVPSLDQVAADLAAAPVEPQPVQESAPEASAVATPDSATPAPGSIVPETASPEAQTSQVVAPTTPESPISGAIASEPAAPVSPIETTSPEIGLDGTPITPAAEPVSAETPSETLATPTETPMDTPVADESSVSSSASFIGDAPVAAPKTSTEEDEEPLQPAAPVPGSIGSALAYSETAPGNAVPVTKPKKQKEHFKLDKTNMRLLIVIIASVVLIAVVVVILLFVFNGNSNSKTTTTKTTTRTVPEPVVSSLTCTLEGGSDKFPSYGNVENGTDSVVAMYTDDELTSLGNTMKLTYPDLESAESGLAAARETYVKKYTAAGLAADPFDSSYDIDGPSVTVTHQADAELLNTTNAKVFDLYVVRGEIVTDIETLNDSYETAGYTCVEK